MSYYIIIRGPLGSGKSTISKKLHSLLNAKLFAVDRVLDEHDLTTDKEDGYISQKSFFKVNEIIVPEAKKFLESGVPVIFDGNFYWKSQIDDLISKLKFPYVVFTLLVPLEICIQRDMNRDKTHGKDAATVVYKKSTGFTYGIEIDGTQPIDKCIEEIVSRLPHEK